MAGCVTPSLRARAVRRHGPDRSSVASVAAAVSDRPGGLTDKLGRVAAAAARASREDLVLMLR